MYLEKVINDLQFGLERVVPKYETLNITSRTKLEIHETTDHCRLISPLTHEQYFIHSKNVRLRSSHWQ